MRVVNIGSIALVAAVLWFCGCDDTAENDSCACETCPCVAEGEFACRVSQPSPYPDQIPYVGVHGNRANNDYIPCESAENFEESWHVLKGAGIAQPNTFSPDSETTYVTTTPLGDDSCTVYALDVRTGDSNWCKPYPRAVASTVEVDASGDLYFATESQVVSLSADGKERWTLDIPQDEETERATGAVGLHFSVNGHIATVTDAGTVYLIRRSDGELLADLSIPEEFGLVPPEAIGSGLNLLALLPDAVATDFENLFGDAAQDFIATFAGGGAFSDNTLGVAPDGDLYVIGGGLTTDTGALVQIKVGGTEAEPTLTAGWRVDTVAGSATSPSISPDGAYVSIGDGSSTTALLGQGDTEANIRVVNIEDCNTNTDDNPDTDVCKEEFTVPFASGPSLGSMPMLDGSIHYNWEVQLGDLFAQERPDLRAYEGDELLWEASLPDDRQWTSVITVTDNHLIGTVTTLTESNESLLSVTLPATANSEVAVVDRNNGDLVFAAPVSDDATSTVTIGPDGSLYVNMLTLVHLFAVDTESVGGIIRFEPVTNED